jgi:hypothetical protein
VKRLFTFLKHYVLFLSLYFYKQFQQFHYFHVDCTEPPCYKMLHKTSEWVGSCEHGNEFSGSTKGRKFLD